jgi:O-antigen/teichoic acid export membrane protein
VIQVLRRRFRDRLWRDSSYMYFTQLVSTGTGFLASIVLTRVITVSEYGTIALVVSLVNTIALFLDFRVEEAIVRFATEYRALGDKGHALQVLRVGLWIDVGLGIATFAVVIILVPFLCRFYPNTETFAHLMRIYALVPLVSTANGSLNAVLTTFRRFDRVASWRILQSVLFLIVPPVLGIQGGVEGVVWGHWTVHMVTTSALAIFSWREFQARFHGIEPASIRPRFAEMGHFCLHTTVSSALKSVVDHVDVVLLGAFCPPAEISYYKVGMSGAKLMTLLAAPAQSVLLPTLSQVWVKGDRRQFRRILLRFTVYALCLSLPVAVGMAFVADWLVLLFYPPEYLPAALVIRIAVWGLVVANMRAWGRPAILSMGRPQLLTYLMTAAMVLRVCLNLILIPRLGFVGATCTGLVVRVVNLVGMTIVLRTASRPSPHPSNIRSGDSEAE